MKHSEFVSRMKNLKFDADHLKTNLYKQDNELVRKVNEQIEETYISHIQGLIISLNECDTEDDVGRNIILQCILDTNRLYFSAKGLHTHGQVLFTRHGESSTFWDKALGLNPNAPISTAAQQNMAKTNSATHFLLFDPQTTPRIAISPMTRALQTAALIIPKCRTNSDISIEPALSENSISPSGCDIRSVKNREELRSKISFLRSPIKAFLFFLSRWIFGEGTFKAMKTARADAIDTIQQRNSASSIIDAEGEVQQDLHLTQCQKITQTMKLIAESQDRDLWLIGHGNNFRTFFKSTFDLEVDFDYGETHTVFKICGNPEYFVPPYSFCINQSTGKIEGKFSGDVRFVHAQDLSPMATPDEHESTTGVPVNHSYRTMHESGLQREIFLGEEQVPLDSIQLKLSRDHALFRELKATVARAPSNPIKNEPPSP
jgi:hypothetical protein